MADGNDINSLQGSNENLSERPIGTEKVSDLSVNYVKFFATIAGLVFWAYGLINVFIFSIDHLLYGNISKRLYWILEFKSVILIAIVAITWFMVGTKKFVVLFIYITFFPIIIFGWLFWSIARQIFISRSWFIIISAIEIYTSIFADFKSKFLAAAIFIASANYIIFGDAYEILFACATLISFLIILAYVQGFASAISPPNTFKLVQKIIDKEENVRFKVFRLDDDIRDKPLATLSSSELTKWNNVLQNSIIYNRGMLFFARAMRDYQRSNLLFMPGVIIILQLTVFTVVGFALVNFAAFKIDAASYIVKPGSGLFSFFYYSFNSLVLNGIDDVKPAKIMTQSLLMVQELLSFVLALILVSVFISFRTQRASSDIDRAVEVAEAEAASIESWLQREFKVASIARAIDHLREAEGSLIKFIHWLSKGI